MVRAELLKCRLTGMLSGQLVLAVAETHLPLCMRKKERVASVEVVSAKDHTGRTTEAAPKTQIISVFMFLLRKLIHSS